jgi:hypothetical protein
MKIPAADVSLRRIIVKSNGRSCRRKFLQRADANVRL